jgi:hypothetical protein
LALGAPLVEVGLGPGEDELPGMALVVGAVVAPLGGFVVVFDVVGAAPSVPPPEQPARRSRNTAVRHKTRIASRSAKRLKCFAGSARKSQGKDRFT